MKKAIVLGMLLTGWLVINPALTWGQALAPEGTITTQGHGEVKVPPDALSVVVTVESNGATMDQTRKLTNDKMTQVLAALKALKIPNLKLQTQSLQVYPVYNSSVTKGPNKVTGYRSVNSVSATVVGAVPDQLGVYGVQLVGASLDAGADRVGNVNFYLENKAAAKSQALEAAVKDAEQNAQVIAQAAHVTITGLYSLEGSPQYAFVGQQMMTFARKAESASAVAPTPIEVGETTVTSDVNARYKF